MRIWAPLGDGTVTVDRVNNQLWRQLAGDVRERLSRHARRVTLRIGEMVFRAHERPLAVYFPETAVVSRIARLGDGQTLEVGLIGDIDIAGISILPGAPMAYDGVVQIGGTAVRVEAMVMSEEIRGPGAAHDLLGRYTWMLLAETVQLAACNNFHRVEQRCARWLLMMDDIMGRHEFPITQDLLAQMLGVRRATVTRAAQALHQQSLIEYKHGRLVVVNRHGLEAACCECYQTLRNSRAELLAC